MKNILFNLLLIGYITLTILSCKVNGKLPENSDSTKDKGEFIDIRDSKVYKWVKIGEQIWMAENLNYTGSDIQYITDKKDWKYNSDYDGWCYYDNNPSYRKTYGVLYQWEAAKKACPSGWHLPTDEEWKQLENYLIENKYSYNGIVGDKDIAKSLAADNGWAKSDNKGAIGNIDFPKFRNKTGFSAIPSGGASNEGTFDSASYISCWWSATEYNKHLAYNRALFYNDTKVFAVSAHKSAGFSVRCIRD